MDQGWPVDTDQPGESYALSGKLMLTAVSIFFGVVVFMACLHLYARWYALRLRRHQLESRGQRRNHILLHAAERHPSSFADRGLEPSVLNSLPVFLYSPKAAPLECAVCLSEFEEKEVVRPLPKCGHSFHVECIGMWFHSHSTCPLCRSPVEKVANRAVRSSTEEGSIEEASGSEPNTSSGTGLCTTFQHEEGNGSNKTSFSGRNKGIGGGTLGIRIEAAPPRPAEVNNELNQSSPGTRRLSSKRLLSITRKPSVSFGATTPQGAAELDLEGGLSEPVRVE